MGESSYGYDRVRPDPVDNPHPGLLMRRKFVLRNKSETDDLSEGIARRGASGHREHDGYA